jgi:hypothetical protein
MKLLIIAGPYEADRIRRASLQAGFETVAVEPGESLSGWITASRPELIVMAPQIVHADPALALAKVRAVPRGRVPIFLVGDEADEARMRDLADGFFLRPVAPELLLERARAILSPGRSKGDASGPRRSGDALERTEMGIGPTPVPSPAPAPGSGGINAANEFARGGRTPKSGPHGPGGRSGATLKPLVATAAGGVGGGGRSGRPDMSALMAELDTGIDALFDAELIAAVAQGPQVPKAQRSGPLSSPAGAPVRPPAKVVSRPETRLPAKPEARSEPEPAAEPKPAVESAPKPEARAELQSEAEAEPESEAKADFEDEPTKKVQPSFLGAALQVSAGGRARARLLERYAPVEEGDYFAVLGVARDASAADLRRAHERIVREIAPDAIEPELARELAAQIDAIRVVSAEALRVLGDERLRPRYLSHVSK